MGQQRPIARSGRPRRVDVLISVGHHVALQQDVHLEKIYYTINNNNQRQQVQGLIERERIEFCFP